MTKKKPHGRIIAVANNKGGCGKTCTAQNIGHALASVHGLSVLLVDLDGQANLTTGEHLEPASGLYDAMKGKGAAEPVATAAPGVDMIPACRDLSALNVELSKAADRVARLAVILAPFRAAYDVILIDTPPAADILAINAFYACDEVLVTTRPLPYDLQGVAAMQSNLSTIADNRGRDIPLSVLITQFDKRKGLHKAAADTIEANGYTVLSTRIRECVAIAEANVQGQDVITYAPRSNGAQDYTAAAAELLRNIQKRG